jgi:hypothetical protein
MSVTAIKTSNYTAAASEVVRCNPTGGAFAVTLPTAVGNDGASIVVKNVSDSENTITVGTTGGQTIDGASSRAFNTPRSNETYVSDGANWMVL